MTWRQRLYLAMYTSSGFLGLWMLWYTRALVRVSGLFAAYYGTPLLLSVLGLWLLRSRGPSPVLLAILGASALVLGLGDALDHGQVVPAPPVLVALELFGATTAVVLVADIVMAQRLKSQ